VWILSIGYSLFKKYGVLTFSTLNKKYFYLDKINIITRAVINELRANIARDALIKTSFFIGFAICCILSKAVDGSIKSVWFERYENKCFLAKGVLTKNNKTFLYKSAQNI
jgi:hypothetical protein